MVHRARYGAVAQFFHSATAVFVLIAFTFGPGGSEQRVYAHARDFDRQLHETLGLCVFALVAMRVLWRIVDRQPEPPQVSLWMSVAAKAVQWTLYLILFALLLTGIPGTWLEGRPLTLLAGLEIPSFFGVSHNAGATVATIQRGEETRSYGSRGFMRWPGSAITLSSRTAFSSQCIRVGFPLPRSNGD
jgi:cytochrome b561